MTTPLTDQERHQLWEAGDHYPEMCDCAGDDWSAEGQWCAALEDTFAAVERIAAAVAAERDRLLGKVEALANSPDDTQWWPVVPYRDDGGNEDDEVVEVHVVNADRLCALVAEERTT